MVKRNRTLALVLAGALALMSLTVCGSQGKNTSASDSSTASEAASSGALSIAETGNLFRRGNGHRFGRYVRCGKLLYLQRRIFFPCGSCQCVLSDPGKGYRTSHGISSWIRRMEIRILTIPSLLRRQQHGCASAG